MSPSHNTQPGHVTCSGRRMGQRGPAPTGHLWGQQVLSIVASMLHPFPTGGTIQGVQGEGPQVEKTLT